MSLFSKKKIRVGAKSRSRIPLNSHVVTTNDFGFIQPIYAREVVPGDKWSIDMRTFCRLAPMPVPVLSRIKIINRAYYVRFRNVWKGWESFYNDDVYFSGVNGSSRFFSKVPNFTNKAIVLYFLGQSVASQNQTNTVDTKFVTYHKIEVPNLTSSDSDSSGSHIRPFGRPDYSSARSIRDSFDINDWRLSAIIDNGFSGSNTPNYKDSYSTGTGSDKKVFVCGWRFTPLGRRIMSVLRGLGYSINWSLSDDTSMSLLPLLCFCRSFYDYVLPSKYSIENYYRSLFEYDYPSFQSCFAYLERAIFNYYDNDYFTSSWVTPFSPYSTSQTEKETTLFDYPREDSQGETLHETAVTFNKGLGGTFLYNNTSTETNAGISNISKYMLDSLNALYSWGTRRGLAGNKYFETIFSQFGVKLPNVLTNRCEFLGSSVQTVQISDVTATAATDPFTNKDMVVSLGDFAGKGISYSDGKRINFEAGNDDFGFVFITSQIIPDTGYVQGRNRETLHLDRLAYFQPEFDNLGMQGLRNDELYSDLKNPADWSLGINYGLKPSSIFGYVPRYVEYKAGRDLLNGDFRVPHLNTGLESFHTFRLFDVPSDSNRLANTEDFRIINPSKNGSNFDRIFNVTDQTADHFIFEHWINANVYRKMESVTDSLDLEGGHTITVDPDNNLSN